jgi:DNA topoisomerase-3
VQLIIAEKPSVARDLARVLGVRVNGKNCFEDKTRVITWCVGHLVELEEPAAYDARWKSWRLDTLPMLPREFRLRAVPGTRDQFAAVCGLLCDGRFTEVVNACDAGREGELIFRYVYQLSGSHLAIRRLWISSLTDEAIRNGFAGLRPGGEFESLGNAARCRSEADWLVGLNATRAVTVRYRTGENSALYSIGRVQTPTLAILVEREKALAAFVPQDYWLLKADLTTADGAHVPATFAVGKVSRFGNQAAADEVRDRCRAHAGIADPLGPVVETLKRTQTREPPPLLFDLTSLQRTANKRFGLSASATLEAAQALYERHKILTYPRTDSRHLSSDMAAELPRLFRGVAEWEDYAPFARPLLAEPPKTSKRIFDDSKVQDHHAIVPTGKVVAWAALDNNQRRIFDLVARRFLGAFYPDAEFAQTEAIIRVGAPAAGLETASVPEGDVPLFQTAPPPPDRFVARGKTRLVAGWQDVAGFGDDDDKPKKGKGKDDDDDATGALPPLEEGQRLDGAFDVHAKKTKPPTRHTEASLLSAMENAGRSIEDEELRTAMKDSGLGTPATRAATIETLIKRSFVRREGKHLVPTGMGMGLVTALPVPSLASPELTGQWEARLARMARGQEDRAAFMGDIAQYVKDVVAAVRVASPMKVMPDPPSVSAPKKRRARVANTAPESTSGAPPSKRRVKKKAADAQSAPVEPSVRQLVCPQCGQGHLMAGKRGWGCDRWREGCRFVVWFEENGIRRTEADLRALVAGRSAR